MGKFQEALLVKFRSTQSAGKPTLREHNNTMRKLE
jgi:hypothetical protein